MTNFCSFNIPFSFQNRNQFQAGSINIFSHFCFLKNFDKKTKMKVESEDYRVLNWPWYALFCSCQESKVLSNSIRSNLKCNFTNMESVQLILPIKLKVTKWAPFSRLFFWLYNEIVNGTKISFKNTCSHAKGKLSSFFQTFLNLHYQSRRNISSSVPLINVKICEETLFRADIFSVKTLFGTRIKLFWQTHPSITRSKSETNQIIFYSQVIFSSGHEEKRFVYGGDILLLKFQKMPGFDFISRKNFLSTSWNHFP